MEVAVKNILKQAYAQYGNVVFLDDNRLKAFLSDLLAEYPVERKRISIAINENIIESAINDGDSRRANIYIDMLQSTYGLPDDVAFDVVETIYYAIYGIQLHRNSIWIKDGILGAENPAEKVDNNPEKMSSIQKYDKSLFKIEGTILKKYLWNDPIVYIPHGITEVSCEAFNNCDYIREVHFSDTVKLIGRWAFRGCRNLGVVELSSSVEEISGGAFENCVGLKSIDTCKCKVIGFGTFDGCNSLKNVVFGDEIQKIGGKVLNGTAYYNDRNNWNNGCLYVGNHLVKVDCNDKIEMFIKRGTKTIADNAFDGTNITGLHIPYGIKRIPDSFCERCSELVEISIPESVTEIGCSAFYKCSNMKAINLPESLIEIDCNSFGDCKSLQRIKIPENTVKIGNTAFINCTNLSRVNLPKSIKKIGYRVFDNTSFYNDAANWNDGLLYADNCLICGNNPVQKTNSNIHIKEGITFIADCAFYNNKEISNVIIPEGVSEIPESSFYGCTSIKSVSLPTSLLSIKRGAFSGCQNINKIVIPKNVKKIEQSAFLNCGKLEIHIPKSVVAIDKTSFNNTDTTIICESDSYALSYAKEENIEYRLIGTFGEEVNEKYQALNLSGYTIAYRYELIDIIQKKRNTIIYKARCKLLNRFVCVEILKESMLRNPTNERTFLKAAQKAACLNNMNILSIYDCGNEQGIPYVVKEYIGMTTLDYYCSSKNLIEFKMYSVNEFKSFIKQIIAGLQYAYEKEGILHGDLCPKNVFLDSEGKVKINYNYVNDNAREKEDYAYTSPEQFMNRIIGMQSDVYSLGCIMMRLISGHPPFSGTSYVDIATKHISEIIKPTMLTGEQIPDGIAEVLLKMIAKNPADRYNSYDEIIYAVENI